MLIYWFMYTQKPINIERKEVKFLTLLMHDGDVYINFLNLYTFF